MFKREADFEEALVQLLLTEKGWQEVLTNPTEKDLVNNWANILYENNSGVDRLNGQPLTDGEMAQILEKINHLKTPLQLNGFINGKSVSIVRDNPMDTLHFGKEVSLTIYDRMEIAAGQSRYQIARQPQFPTKSAIKSNRKGDLMLLINGMPVFHIELKKSGSPVSQATNQIEFYAKNDIFTGLFSLVQIFVAMTPEDTVYFANPGPEGKFNPAFYFNWADVNNEPEKNWESIASNLISIPMAHQLIGFYTVADKEEGILKVMRSYQFWAAHAITDRVTKIKWDECDALGGYIWHTTGSGKTMTSFKSAQLIANSKDADKVIFLMDRIELGTQSLKEYRAFAEESEAIQDTENSGILIAKLKSTLSSDTLIVTSIQKMSQIKDEEGEKIAKDIEMINNKRIVIIVDEAHRSTFGKMLLTIKDTFPHAVFFGFTGTPIHDENRKKDNTTADVFGNELHRYSIADGIRDKNVLGFDPNMVTTFKDKDVRIAVALDKAKATGGTTEEKIKDVLANANKKKIYDKYMYDLEMAGKPDTNNEYIKGIEDYLPNTQYGEIHREMVVENIIENWLTLSQNSKFHAIFATHSIPQAIAYYRLLKTKKPDLKVTALFDPSIDFDDSPDNSRIKEDGLVEIITDYNHIFNKTFTIANHGKFKKDIALRLAHKETYKGINHLPEEQLDILIVVDQMLTGFDSKWVNTLYMDKVIQYAEIIQAFSRTNRLFGPDKPFGNIRYYRKPHTMKRNIKDAVKLYSGDKSFGLFVDKLEGNISMINFTFEEIKMVFTSAGVPDFIKLPDDNESRGKFAKLFKALTAYLEAAKIQGFKWEQTKYVMSLNEQTYSILAVRYKELFNESVGSKGNDDVPYDLDGYLTEIDTGMIDTNYMNAHFEKYLKTLRSSDTKATEEALNNLHKTFATLTQEEQRYANIFLRDIRRGDANIEDGKSLRDYITEYQIGEKSAQIKKVAMIFGLDENLLLELTKLQLTESNINEFGRFKRLMDSVDRTKAKAYFEKIEGISISVFVTNGKIDKLLREFLLKGGFDLDEGDIKV
ncbi:MAG: HsdR family type I site-specific deoxyribonuclease [Defluviitaleaceae bacterium]|nr:HsdR family type I site-specific deoxyribonuclease [Defluviitaleaceae bacterium]